MLAPSTPILSAFQCNHRTPSNNHYVRFKQQHRPSIVSPLYLSALERDNTKPIHLVVETLLEAGNIDEAVTELRRRRDAGVDLTSSFHAIIEACCAGGGNGKKYTKGQRKTGGDQLELAYSLLQSMQDASPHAYDILISGYARRGKWSDASKLLTEMEGKFRSDSTLDTVPSLNTYQTLLAALANNGQYDKMMSLLTRIRRRGVKPTVYTFNTLMNICAQANPSRWKEALSLLSQCQREPGVNPDLVTYTTAMR